MVKKAIVVVFALTLLLNGCAAGLAPNQEAHVGFVGAVGAFVGGILGAGLGGPPGALLGAAIGGGLTTTAKGMQYQQYNACVERGLPEEHCYQRTTNPSGEVRVHVSGVR
ncbi:MAG: hypothetical protein HYT78_08300 [Deltaproteobacteria bacterium]|nr:hypothetical protein [Deltaproteobacteria bacterium]